MPYEITTRREDADKGLGGVEPPDVAIRSCREAFDARERLRSIAELAADARHGLDPWERLCA